MAGNLELHDEALNQMQERSIPVKVFDDFNEGEYVVRKIKDHHGVAYITNYSRYVAWTTPKEGKSVVMHQMLDNVLPNACIALVQGATFDSFDGMLRLIKEVMVNEHVKNHGHMYKLISKCNKDGIHVLRKKYVKS